MSTLHQRLLAELDGYDGTYGASKPLAALRAAVEMHAPVVFWRPWAGEPATCKTCLVPDCSTIQAIARELGVDHGR